MSKKDILVPLPGETYVKMDEFTYKKHIDKMLDKGEMTTERNKYITENLHLFTNAEGFVYVHVSEIFLVNG